MNEKDIFELRGEGFKKILDFQAWRIARNGCRKGVNDRFSVTSMGRHRKTTETFVLLTGEAFLLTGGRQEDVGDIRCRKMEKERLYVVPEKMWHFLVLEEGALALIVENANTGTENSDVVKLSKEQMKAVREEMKKKS